MRSLCAVCLISTALWAQGSSYRWIRELGGSERDNVQAVAVDAAGNTYVAGSTESPDFPVKDAQQALPGGAPLYRIAGNRLAERLSSTGVATIYSVAFSPCEPSAVYAGSTRLLLSSRDGGRTWDRFPLPAPAVNSLAVTCDRPDAPAIFAVADGVLYRTRDARQWDRLDTGARSVYQVYADPHAPATIYARTVAGLARSVDSGERWTTPGTFTFDLTFDLRKPGILYAPVIQYSTPPFIEAIVPARSADFGQTWTPLARIEDRDVHPQIVFPDPARDGVLFAATYIGFFVSRDGGQSWTRTGLPLRPPVAIDAASGAIYSDSAEGVVVSRDGFDSMATVLPRRIGLITGLAARGGIAFASTYSSTDLFLTKMDPEGAIVYSTYFGGSGYEQPSALAVAADGSLHVAGSTSSGDFPATGANPPGPGQDTGFVAKFDPAGRVVYSTFFPARVSSIAIDAEGRAVLGGTAAFGGLPTTPGAYQTAFKGTPAFFKFAPVPTNAFVTKLSEDGQSLIFSTYLGEQSDTGDAIALGDDGSVYVGGAHKLFHLSADGSRLLASSAVTHARAIARDPSGSLYAVTSSPGSLVAQFNLTQWDARLDVMAVKALPGASSVSIAALGGEKLLLAGSATPALPTVAPTQGPFSPQTGFVSEFGPGLSTIFTTFTGDDRIFAVANAAAAPDGAIVFAGSTEVGTVYTSEHSFPPAASGPADVYVARLMPQVPELRLDSIANSASFETNPLARNETVIVTGAGFGEDAAVVVDGEPVEVVSRSGSRIVAALPAGLRVEGAVTVEVASGGARSNAVLMRAAAGSPGIFSVDGSGRGQGYIRNADGTPNGPSNPAAEGETVTVFVNGGTPGVPASALVYGFAAKVVSATAGPVEGLPGSVYQLTFTVPRPSELNPDFRDFKLPAQVPVHVVLDGVRSQNGITMSLK